MSTHTIHVASGARFVIENEDSLASDVRAKVVRLGNLVLTAITALVEQENDVVVKAQANHRRVMFTVHVHDEDVGFAVGAQGRHADALRTLLIAACKKLRFHFDLDIIGPSGKADWSSG